MSHICACACACYTREARKNTSKLRKIIITSPWPGRGRARERAQRTVFHADTSAVRGACVRVNAHIIIYRAAAPLTLQREKGGAEHALKNEWNKWKNHFFKMKGDVGMV